MLFNRQVCNNNSFSYVYDIVNAFYCCMMKQLLHAMKRYGTDYVLYTKVINKNIEIRLM